MIKKLPTAGSISKLTARHCVRNKDTLNLWYSISNRGQAYYTHRIPQPDIALSNKAKKLRFVLVWLDRRRVSAWFSVQRSYA